MTDTPACAEPSSAQSPRDAWWIPQPIDDKIRRRAEMAVMRLLFTAGERGATKTEVSRKLRLKRDQIDQVIIGLLASNQILRDECRDNRGRPTTTLRINVAAIT